MLQLETPHRSCVLQIADENFSGHLISVARLPESVATSKVRQLINGDQLVVSSCGFHVAQVHLDQDGTEVIHHSIFGAMKPSFLSPPRQWGEGTRILKVGSRYVLVWGRVKGYPPGVWFLAPGMTRFLYHIDRLMARRGSRLDHVPVGTRTDYPDQQFYLTSWGLWQVGHRSITSVNQDSLCVIESIEGLLYVYEATASGVSSFHQINLLDAERAVGLVRWQGKLMLAISRWSQSWFVELGADSKRYEHEKIHIDGRLLGVWSSPNGKTLLMLVHPRASATDVRSLVLSTGEIIREGAFILDPATIAWSKDECTVAAQITRLKTPNNKVSPHMIVGSEVRQPLPAGVKARELIVGDDGRLQAFIQTDGMYDKPLYRGTYGTAVPIAWNLHHGPGGSITWTTVHFNEIYTWVSQLARTPIANPIAH